MWYLSRHQNTPSLRETQHLAIDERPTIVELLPRRHLSDPLHHGLIRLIPDEAGPLHYIVIDVVRHLGWQGIPYKTQRRCDLAEILHTRVRWNPDHHLRCQTKIKSPEIT